MKALSRGPGMEALLAENVPTLECKSWPPTCDKCQSRAGGFEGRKKGLEGLTQVLVVVASTLGAIGFLKPQLFHLQNGQSCAPQDVLSYPISLRRVFSELWGLLLTVLHRAPPLGNCKRSVSWSPPNG